MDHPSKRSLEYHSKREARIEQVQLIVTQQMLERLNTCKSNEDIFCEFHNLLNPDVMQNRYIHSLSYDGINGWGSRTVTLELREGPAPYLEAALPMMRFDEMMKNHGLKFDSLKAVEFNFEESSTVWIETNPAEPAYTEESEMGFGKKGGKYPDDIKDLDFTALHTSQMWVLADFVGCRNTISSLKTKDEQLKALEKVCRNFPDEAQRGYELIVLLKKPEDVKIDSDSKEHYVNLLIEILNKYSSDLDASGKNSLQKIVDGMKVQADSLKSTLTDFAKQAVRDAADKRAPLIIKDKGSTRKIKGVLPPEFKRMVELASERIPIMLVGPAGCGKTYLGEKLAEALDMDFSDQSCSEGMSESVFNGLLLPIGAGGEFKHVSSPFMDRYETGGVMLLDEIDAGDPNLFTYINKAIANSSYTVAQRHKKPRVDKHEDFVLVAAANTYGNGSDAMYVGRNQLDAATLDRFKVGLITMDYCHEVEEALAPDEVCKWAWEIRAKIKTNKLRRIMSTRVIENIGRMTERYKWKKEDWNKCYFTGWTEAEKTLVGVA